MELVIFANGINNVGITISKFNEISINFKYSSIASTFAFKCFFDTQKDKSIFIPGSYFRCQIINDGEVLLTGTILNYHFERDSAHNYVTIAGYTLTGVLEDCFLTSEFQQSWENSSLKDIVAYITGIFGINYIIDYIVSDVANEKYTEDIQYVTNDNHPLIREFLQKLCVQKNLILSHTASGKLLITRVKADENISVLPFSIPEQYPPVDDILEGSPLRKIRIDNQFTNFKNSPIYRFHIGDRLHTSMVMTFNGQAMHSVIEVVTQNMVDTDDTTNKKIINPYVGTKNTIPYNLGQQIFRPRIDIQTNGDNFTLEKLNRNILQGEIQNIYLTIKIAGWDVGGALVRPNQLIVVNNPDCYIYEDTVFFINEVQLNADEKGNNATLVCCLPDCYSDKPIEEIKNIFI